MLLFTKQVILDLNKKCTDVYRRDINCVTVDFNTVCQMSKQGRTGMIYSENDLIDLGKITIKFNLGFCCANVEPTLVVSLGQCRAYVLH